MDKLNILNEFKINAHGFLERSTDWLNESRNAYMWRDGRHWSDTEAQERTAKNKKVAVINLAGAYVRAIAGTLCSTHRKLDVFSTDQQFNSEVDVMADGVEYCHYASGWHNADAASTEDAATCGVGATVTYLDFTAKEFIAGLPTTERVFPLFAMFDRSNRGGDLNKGRWCAYGQPMAIRDVEEYLEQNGIKDAGGGDTLGLQLLSNLQTNDLDDIEFLYHYFWWDYADIYDVANPLDNEQLAQLVQTDPEAAETLAQAASKAQVDLDKAFWALDKQAYNDINEALKVVAFITGQEYKKLKYSKRYGKCYYRAEIARDRVIKASKSYTQGGHPLNFKTALFDETTGNYYGLMRFLAQVQQSLNVSFSDFLSYLSTVCHGGSVYVKGVGEAIEQMIAKRAYEDSVTPLPQGAEIIQKALPNASADLVQAIQLAIDIMPMTIGVNKEFMGIITSGDMTDSLFSNAKRSAQATLYHLSNSLDASAKRQGEIFIDIVRLMAESDDGMVLPALSAGHGKEQYTRLAKQNIARTYAIRIAEQPLTIDERKDTTMKLLELMPTMQPPLQQAVMPIIIRGLPIDQQDKDTLTKLATPEPSQPDPINAEMLQSTIRLQNAQAAEKEAKASKTQGEMESVIEKNLAQAQKSLADAGVKALEPIMNQPIYNNNQE